ncbi:hypothetical protein KC328_g82 [Hortaea werneckii]|nr:hypothetical protein KC328_g82 [Hortaea werneckii]
MYTLLLAHTQHDGLLRVPSRLLSPHPYSQIPSRRRQRPHFDIEPSLRLGRAFFDNVSANHAPSSYKRHRLHTLGHNPDLFATDVHNSIAPNQASAAYVQPGRGPYLAYNFSSSSGAVNNTHGINRAGTRIDYSGSYDQDDRHSRRPFQSSPTQRTRSSSSDGFVYDVGFKSVQDARRRAARREREHGSRHPSYMPLENRFETSPFAMVVRLAIVFALRSAMTLSGTELLADSFCIDLLQSSHSYLNARRSADEGIQKLSLPPGMAEGRTRFANVSDD